MRQAILRSSPHHVRRRSVSHGSETRGPHETALQESATHPRPRFSAIGLYLVHGVVGADVLPLGQTAQLARILRARANHQSLIPAEWHRYAAVVFRGRFYRLATAAHLVVGFGSIEAFWAYLQRKLRAKGGIRRERLELYVAEYVWRYNRRHLSPAEQLRELLALIRQHPRGERKRTRRRHKTGESGSLRHGSRL